MSWVFLKIRSQVKNVMFLQDPAPHPHFQLWEGTPSKAMPFSAALCSHRDHGSLQAEGGNGSRDKGEQDPGSQSWFQEVSGGSKTTRLPPACVKEEELISEYLVAGRSVPSPQCEWYASLKRITEKQKIKLFFVFHILCSFFEYLHFFMCSRCYTKPL